MGKPNKRLRMFIMLLVLVWIPPLIMLGVAVSGYLRSGGSAPGQSLQSGAEASKPGVESSHTPRKVDRSKITVALHDVTTVPADAGDAASSAARPCKSDGLEAVAEYPMVAMGHAIVYVRIMNTSSVSACSLPADVPQLTMTRAGEDQKFHIIHENEQTGVTEAGIGGKVTLPPLWSTTVAVQWAVSQQVDTDAKATLTLTMGGARVKVKPGATVKTIGEVIVTDPGLDIKLSGLGTPTLGSAIGPDQGVSVWGTDRSEPCRLSVAAAGRSAGTRSVTLTNIGLLPCHAPRFITAGAARPSGTKLPPADTLFATDGASDSTLGASGYGTGMPLLRPGNAFTYTTGLADEWLAVTAASGDPVDVTFVKVDWDKVAGGR
ncbi:hypothetical protein [Bifidobacterium leontopitheci]|uniref:DUF4232 domain-containing protein n=1 Tax=Bifidobacterium leontopitheci TaxID=2650774 RepID=A0A6I1GIW0_9BIFI|nr:hypothetical protein [Bifidobacterium leontopitheci]KAB7790652.1 hypothetical protein F7D09_0758 [Bifidobacterium leontopitheci]